MKLNVLKRIRSLNIEELAFKRLPFSELFTAYVSNKESLKPFFDYNFKSDQDILKKIEEFSYSGDRSELVSILKNFNANFDLHENARTNLESLADKETLTVTTGQQMVIAGGPLFTIFKTITAIHYARRVEKLTGRKTVPVFWLADEDHDFEEVASIRIPSGEDLHTVTVDGDLKNQGKSVSRISLDGCYESFVSELKEHFYETDFTQQLFDLIKNSYGQNCSFKNGFARILSALFSEHGLIFAGSDDAKIKSYTSNILATATKQNEAIISSLNSQSEEIASVFHAQAHVQDSLLFYHDEIHGRERIKRIDENTWGTGNSTEWSDDQLASEIKKSPELFSPNVFLRPVLQDALLPNVAYVAGPGEISYYAQMKKLYHAFDTKMPIIVPRLSATLVEASIRRISKDLHFEFPDFQKRIEDLEKEYIASSSEDDLEELFQVWKKDIDEITAKHVETITKYDASLKGSAERITIGYHKSLDKLSQKLRKSLKQREEVQLQRIRKIKNNIFPDDNLQEREVAMIYFMNKYGMDIWTKLLEATSEIDLESHKIVFL